MGVLLLAASILGLLRYMGPWTLLSDNYYIFKTVLELPGCICTMPPIPFSSFISSAWSMAFWSHVFSECNRAFTISVWPRLQATCSELYFLEYVHVCKLSGFVTIFLQYFLYKVNRPYQGLPWLNMGICITIFENMLLYWWYCL